MNKPEPKKPDLEKIANIMSETKEVKAGEPTINPELRDLLDTLDENEFNELKKSIEAEGIRDAIIVWKETGDIVDGHNRLKVAKMLGVEYRTIEKSFPDVGAVKQWMLRNQIGRRNLSPERRTYYIGKLYNETKQDPEEKRTPTDDGKTTAQVIGEQLGVSERTVRRAGEFAKGVDKIEQIRGKIEKNRVLTGKSSLTQDELKEVGKATNAAVASKTLEKIERIKQQVKQDKQDQRQVAKTAAASTTTYPVAFVAPAFESMTYSASMEPKPPLDKEALVYMKVSDEYLDKALALLEKWGLQYEGSFVFTGIKPYDGVYTRVAHTFMVVATKGTMAGPKAGAMVGSHVSCNDPEQEMAKIIDKYHPQQKKLDMRKGAKVPQGWSVLAK